MERLGLVLCLVLSFNWARASSAASEIGLPSDRNRPEAVFDSLLDEAALKKKYECKDEPTAQWPVTRHVKAEKAIEGFAQMTPAERLTAKFFLRLTGAPVPTFHPRFRRVVSLITQGRLVDAAMTVTEDPNFLQTRVRNFAAPFTNLNYSPNEPLNDLQALIIGITRDQLDARLLLTGNIRYVGSPRAGLPPPSLANNEHYLRFEQAGMSFLTDLEREDDQWPENDVPAAGALTTRAWAKVYYDAGTNRRALKHSLDVFLCAPIEQWKKRGLPDFFVRRDVDRAPSGDPSNYQNHCRNCHSAQDALGGAFAKVDFVGGALTFITEGVAAKMNNNPHFYPEGYVTTDDSWTNLITHMPYGWRAPMAGRGLHTYAELLAQSRAFGQCMVSKVFKEVCGRVIETDAPQLVGPLTDGFEQSTYDLKKLFATVASKTECISQ